jgi:hypothetical protein
MLHPLGARGGNVERASGGIGGGGALLTLRIFLGELLTGSAIVSPFRDASRAVRIPWKAGTGRRPHLVTADDQSAAYPVVIRSF